LTLKAKKDKRLMRIQSRK